MPLKKNAMNEDIENARSKGQSRRFKRGPFSKILRIIDQIENEGYDSYRVHAALMDNFPENFEFEEEMIIHPKTKKTFLPKRRELQEIDSFQNFREKDPHSGS